MNQFTRGIIKENPIFILMLGLCPTLAVTTEVINGLGMGIATFFVLVASNVVVSLIKGFVPEKVRIPVFIVVIASFVTIVDLFMQAFTPVLADALGIFIPLIVVNCIILGRAEAFASKNKLIPSILDGMGMAIGFALSLVLLAFIREVLGSGTITLKLMGMGKVFHIPFLESSKAIIMILPPGAFLTLGLLMALVNKIKKEKNPDGNIYNLMHEHVAPRKMIQKKVK